MQITSSIMSSVQQCAIHSRSWILKTQYDLHVGIASSWMVRSGLLVDALSHVNLQGIQLGEVPVTAWAFEDGQLKASGRTCRRASGRASRWSTADRPILWHLTCGKETRREKVKKRDGWELEKLEREDSGNTDIGSAWVKVQIETDGGGGGEGGREGIAHQTPWHFSLHILRCCMSTCY